MPKRKQKSRSTSPLRAQVEPTTTWNRRAIALLCLIVVATFVVYLPAMGGGMVWDDSQHMTPPEIRSLGGLGRIWFDPTATKQYYPLAHSLFWLEHRMWGDAMRGYHLVNVALHAVAVCLFYVVLRKLAIPGALFAAAIFALHPVHVESVAWITEQKNTLSAVFFLGAMLAYLHFNESRRRSIYAIAFVLFALALSSKTTTVTLPPVLLVILWYQRGALSWKSDVVPLVPFFLLAAAAGLFTIWVEKELVGAVGQQFELSPGQSLLVAGRVVWFYLAKLLWPANLIFIYPRWDVDPGVWWQWLFPIATISLLVALWTIRRRWRAPLAVLLLFAGTLFPVMGFFNVYYFTYSYVADHFQYLPSLGIFALVAGAFAAIAMRLPREWLPAARILAVTLLGVLAILTWRQSAMYSDIVTLYRTTIRENPDCWMAHLNMGVEMNRLGRHSEAVEYFTRTLEINPENAKAHNNLGVQLVSGGRIDEAIEHYHEALHIEPTYADAHSNLGIALFAQGRTGEAIRQFEQATQMKPNLAEAHFNLGFALLQEKQPEAAIESLQRAVELDSENAAMRHNLGIALAQTKQYRQAIPHLEYALQLDPKNINAYADLMVVYAAAEERTAALATAERALAQARANGQPDRVAQIESWVTNYQAGATNVPSISTPPTGQP